MFILMLCCPLLFLSLIWHKLTLNSRSIMRVIFLFSFSIYFTSFYLNGADWSVYFLKFLGDDNPYLSFEAGFVIYFKLLLLISFGQFGTAIFLFYLITFGMLISIVKKYKVNDALFFLSVFMIFGYTLILEQLRQFMACVIILYAFLKYREGNPLKTTLFWIILASFFHISSLIVLPTLFFLSIRSISLFVIFVISSVTAFVVLLFAGYALIDLLGNYSFAFRKVSFYLQQTPISLTFGWLNILDFIFVSFYSLYRKNIDNNSHIAYYARIVFIGAVIHMFSGSVTFLARLGFFYYFIAACLFSLSPNIHEKRLLAIRSYRSLMICVYFSIVLVFNFVSYFRNPVSPVGFYNLNFNLETLFDNKLAETLAKKKFQDAIDNLSVENK
ncbi:MULTISPECIES: EpsG family protein [Rahnella]|uniref:EpsG family protein n=1 Tax=Rahnella TaxID=34037 RepID=UPI003D2B7899